jgi:hypothetical protein
MLECDALPSALGSCHRWHIETKTLVTPRRLDLAVKWRLFRHLSRGGDEDAVRIYTWHIDMRSGPRMKAGLATDRWKRSHDDYRTAAIALSSSMACRGFVPGFAVPIDQNGELLDGSHRVACALALGIKQIPVAPQERYVWAPAWGEAWFVENGMAAEDLERLRRDYAALAASGSGS